MSSTTTERTITKEKLLVYEKYKAIAMELSLVSARAKELEKAKKEQQEELEKLFRDKTVRRLSPNVLLEKKVITVPEAVVTRKGYSYSTYKEIEG